MTTTIGSNTHIEGRVEGDADLDVAGSIEGSVAISQKLTVLENGFIKGEVEAADVQIDGAFEGSLNVSGLLYLTATANVKATIETGALIMEDGAALAGDVTMDVEGDVPRKSTPASSSSTSSTSSTPTKTTASSSSRSSSSSSSSASGTATAKESSSSTTTTTVVEEEEEAAGEDQPTASDLTAAMMEEQTVKELREKLRERDLPVSGTKQELIDRLQEAGDD